MKNVFKFTKTLVLATLLFSFSCSSDDDGETVVINLQNLEVSIDENPNNGDIVGTVQSNSNSLLNFSITSQTPAGALAINANTGELTVADASLFDYEANTMITAIVAASGAQNTANVTININDLADVLVDYTVTIQPDATEGKDAFLGSAAPDNNYGTHPDFMSNRFSGGSVRSLIRFDFSNIPTDAIVNSVEVSFYGYQSPSNGNNFIGKGESYLQKVDSAWDEATVTWNNQPTSSDIDQVYLANAQSTIQDYLDLDITATASGMINDPSTNHGYILKLVDETSTNNKLIFGSSDNTDASLHPKVVVQYSVYE